MGGWEYKLRGSTPHNGITRHNTNKARVQASTFLTQRHTGRVPCPSRFLLISFSVSISSFSGSFFHLHTQTRCYLRPFGFKYNVVLPTNIFRGGLISVWLRYILLIVTPLWCVQTKCEANFSRGMITYKVNAKT